MHLPLLAYFVSLKKVTIKADSASLKTAETQTQNPKPTKEKIPIMLTYSE